MSAPETLLDLEIAPTLESVVAARAELDRIPDPGAPEGRCDLELLVTELLTNSVRHAGLEEHETIRLRVAARPPSLHVEVRDGGRGFEPAVREPPPGAQGGRGLLLVDRLARRWGVARGEETRVWFDLDYFGDAGALAA
jgi:anti-sigma regulatory factor (Ser/Thr protein kinase)